MSERVTTEIRDNIAHVTMTRPDKLNGLDLEMLRGLVTAARDIRRRRDVRAVVLRGAGEAFCAGLDFASVGKHPVHLVRAFLRLPGSATNLFQEACWAWRKLPVPVVAVVHGRCYGGGLQLALAADFRVATPDCELSVLEAKWGLVPDMTATVTLRELVGMDVAKRLTMTGEAFTGRRAAELGLATSAHEEPDAAVDELVGALVTRSPDSVAATKALFHRTRHVSPRRAFRVESRIQRQLMTRKNHKIARKAGMTREPPRFLRRGWG